jgi:hypothetical protein
MNLHHRGLLAAQVKTTGRSGLAAHRFSKASEPAYNRLTGGGPAALRGYQGGPNRNFNQQAGAWQFNQGFGYQGGPNRNFNQQTNKWQWNT